MKAANLVNSLKKKNILVKDATGMYLPLYKKENVIRLSVSQVEETKIEVGIRKIGEEIADLVAKANLNVSFS